MRKIIILALACLLIFTGCTTGNIKEERNTYPATEEASYDGTETESAAEETTSESETESIEETTAEPSVFIPKDSVNLTSENQIITFGSYEQDNDETDGSEPIEWYVLAESNDCLMLVSLYGIDCKQYNSERTEVTWENCELREWLNSDFYNTAFNKEERERIQLTHVKNGINELCGTDGGADTEDYVYLLSVPEAIEYFYAEYACDGGYSVNSYGRCTPTEYTIARGAWYGKDGAGYPCASYWLRSTGYNNTYAANVSGYLFYGGYYVDDDAYMVRPVIWIR